MSPRPKRLPLRVRSRRGAGLPIPPEVTDDGRLMWAEATAKRRRVRRALHALGFERIGFTHATYEPENVMATYVETFHGDLGEVTISWNKSAPPQ